MCNYIKVKNIAGAFFWSTVNRCFEVIIQLISLIILARFIEVEDFAIMGILTFFISLSNILIDSGMGGALIAQKKVDNIDYYTLFTYNLVVSIVIYLVIFFLSGEISTIYRRESLLILLRITCLSLIISSFGIIQNVILTRDLRFKELAIISIISGVSSLIFAIILAVKGFGVWALVAQTISRSVIIVVVQFVYNKFIPLLKFSYVSFKKQWSFGYNILLANMLRTLYENVFSLLFPKLTNMSYSGYYAQANKVQHAPVSVMYGILNTAAFPLLSKMESESEEFIDFVRKLNRITCFIASSFLVWLSFMSESIVQIFLGDKWMPSAQILSILSISGIFVVVYELNRNIFKSLFKTRIILFLEIVKVFLGIFLIFVCHKLFPYTYLIYCILFNAFIIALFSIIKIGRYTNYSALSQVKDFLISILKVLFCAIPSLLIKQFSDNYSVQLVICSTCYIVLILLVDLFSKESIFRTVLSRYLK